METTNSIKRKIWMNIKQASGNEITINRDYLHTLLRKLEDDNYDKGYSDGYRHGLDVHRKNLDIDNDFKDIERNLW